MPITRIKAAAWAVTFALAAYMLWPAWALELAQLTEDAPPPAEAPATEATPGEAGTAEGAPATAEAPAPAQVSFMTRDAWLDAGTYGLADGELGDFPLHFQNWVLFSDLYPGAWMGDWRVNAAAGRGAFYSGDATSVVDRGLQKYSYDKWREQQQFYEWEQEQGLIPDVQLGKESDIKFEGRKLFSAGYSHTSYPEGGVPGYTQPGNDITMEGELQLRIEGTVMRKTHVYVDYDDTRENDTRNQVSVVYKGDPDELVQEAAFGDIMLSLPSTEFVSYSSTRAVFGAKVDLKYKWARLMAVASREKGQTEKATFSGGTELTSLNIADTDYSSRKFFLLNAAHYNNGDLFFQRNSIYLDPSNNDQPCVAVFLFNNQPWPTGTTEYYMNAYEFDDKGGLSGEEQPTGNPYIQQEFKCKRLNLGTDFTVDANKGLLMFNTTLEQGDFLAVAYIIADESGHTPRYRIGYKAGTTQLDYARVGNTYHFQSDLKCVKEDNVGGALQRYEQRNYYNLGSTSIRSTSLIVKLRDNNQSERAPDGRSYLYLYGLDQNNDGRVDAEFIDTTYGYITIPDADVTNHFALKDVGGWRPDGQYKRPDGYFDNLPFDYDENGVAEGKDAYLPDNTESRFSLYVEYQSLKPSYFLHPNIIPGSETVTLNGQRLVPNRDYWLDYDSGFLELLIEGADDPTSVLEVRYEYKPLFALLTKSLVGGRFQFGPDDDRYVATTLIGEFTSKPPPGEIPSADEAPTTHYVFDVDGRFRIFPEVMTKIADAFPGAHTQEESTLDLQGEFARSFKDINTMGVAGVDDMEGARMLSSVALKAVAWRPSSVPLAPDVGQSNRGDNALRVETERGHFLQEVDRNWPRDMLELMRVTGLPNNPEGQAGKPLFKWGGINYVLASSGLDFTDQRFDYTEIMINLNNLTADAADDVTGGVLHLDFGTVDEDTDSDNFLDTEDKNGNGRLDRDEDVGIDFNNVGAGGKINFRYGANNNVLDTEDTNRNGVLDRYNDYFTYTIDLGEVLNGESPYVVRSPHDKEPLEDGWYILRIPFDFDNAEKVGDPDPTRLQALRAWPEALTNLDFPGNEGIGYSSLYFGGVTFAAMKWETPVLEPDRGRNAMKISTKDSRHDADYVPLNPQEDTDTGTAKREQALVMEYILTDWEDTGVWGEVMGPGPFGALIQWGAGNNLYDTEDANHNGVLDPGEDVGVGPNHIGAGNGRLDEEGAPEGSTRLTSAAPQDFSRYRRLGFWIYNKTPQDNGGAESENDIVFLRFGSDDNNYYEYSAQMGRETWLDYNISLENFSNLQKRGQPLIDKKEDVVHGHYRVVGDPSLLNIMELRVGVRTKLPREGGSGGFLDWREIWVNDIQLLDPINQVGTAKRFKVGADFGNFVRVNVGARKMDAGFEELGTTGGARSTTTGEDADATVELAKFMPDKWNARMPVSGSVSKSETLTEEKYDPQQSIYAQGKTVSVSRKIGISFDKYKLPSWDFNFKNSDAINYKYARTTENDTYSGGVDYDLYPKRAFLPANVRSDFDRQYRDETYGDPEEANLNRHWITDDSRSSVTYEPAQDLEVTPSYDYSYTRDRRDRSEESFDETYGGKVSYDRIKGIRPSTTYTSTYRETVQISGEDGGGGGNGEPPAPQYQGLILGEDETLDLSLSTDYNVTVPFEIGKLTGDKAVGFTKWSTTPTYDLTRSSNYDGMTGRPAMSYRVGRYYLLPDVAPDDERLSSSRIRHSVTLNNRFNPLEFLGARKGTKWETWDFIQADVDYSYSNELSRTHSTLSRTIGTTFPDVTVQLTGTKNFPLVANYLDRSTVVASYYRKRTYQEREDLELKQKPGLSWRATWTRTFRTRADYYYTITDNEEIDPETNVRTGIVRTEQEKNPSLTLYYDLAMPRGFKVPLLGTIRWRNELNLTAGVAVTQVRVSANSTHDNTDEVEYTLSGGYYITTNLHADVTGSLKQYTNLTQAGQDYSTVGVSGNFEIIF